MTWSRLGIASLVALALGGAGCYAPEITDYTLQCAPPNDRCPRGFECDPDSHLCRKPMRTSVNLEDSGTRADSGDGSADRGPESGIGGFGGSRLTGAGGGSGPGGATGVGGNGGQIAGTGGTGVGGNGGRITGAGGTGTGGTGVGGNGGRITGTGGTGTGGMGTGGIIGTGVGGAGTGGRTGVGGATAGTGGTIVSGVGGAGTGGSGTGGSGTGGTGTGGTGTGGTPGTGGSGAPNGTACTLGTQCQSNICVDGVCCNRACNGQCEACDISQGVCTTVTSGPVHGARTPCPAGTNPACGSQCAGSPLQCGAFPGGNVSCDCLLGLGLGQCDARGSCALVLLGTLMVCD